MIPFQAKITLKDKINVSAPCDKGMFMFVRNNREKQEKKIININK